MITMTIGEKALFLMMSKFLKQYNFTENFVIRVHQAFSLTHCFLYSKPLRTKDSLVKMTILIYRTLRSVI